MFKIIHYFIDDVLFQKLSFLHEYQTKYATLRTHCHQNYFANLFFNVTLIVLIVFRSYE